MEIKLIVPSTVDRNKPVDNTPYANGVKKAFCNMFGGYTAYNGVGGYVADNGELIEEDVTVVTTVTAKLTRSNRSNVFKLAKQLCADMSQESIFLQLGTKVFFIRS